MIPGSRISSMLLQLFQHCSHEGLGFQARSQEEPCERSVLPMQCWGHTWGTFLLNRCDRIYWADRRRVGNTSPLELAADRKQLLTPSYISCPLPRPLVIESQELPTVLQQAVRWERMDKRHNIEHTWSHLHLQIRSSFAYVSLKTGAGMAKLH